MDRSIRSSLSSHFCPVRGVEVNASGFKGGAKMNMVKLALVAGALSVISGAAGAATLSLAPGGYASHVIGSNGNFDLDTGSYSTLTDGYGRPGNPDPTTKTLSVATGAGAGLRVDGPAKVQYTYLGKEAGYTNSLWEIGVPLSIFEGGSTAVGATSLLFDVDAGLLPFFVKSIGGAGTYIFNNAISGSEVLKLGYLLFNNNKSALVFLDDGGAGPDSDYDDIAFRVDITPVPLPPAILMLLTAIGGLGIFGRLRRAKPELFA